MEPSVLVLKHLVKSFWEKHLIPLYIVLFAACIAKSPTNTSLFEGFEFLE